MRLGPGARVLVIEPQPRDLTPADTTSWLAPGGLAAALKERWPGVESVVVEAALPPEAIAGLRARAATADAVVLGTVDALGQPTVRDLARALLETRRPLVAVALRAPWDAAAYPEAGTVLATYGMQPPTLRALVGAIAGDRMMTGRSPVRLPA